MPAEEKIHNIIGHLSFSGKGLLKKILKPIGYAETNWIKIADF